jgi:catechol 2,3-dioxygenase-like lactoylglutathione lyase family enzyme
MWKRAIVALAVAGVFASPSFGETPSSASQPGPTDSKIVGPVLYVSSVEASLKFYRDILGMSERSRFGPADRPNVSLGYGIDPRQPSLMLVSDRTAPTPRKIEHGHGFDRLVLLVEGLPALQQRLRAGGFVTTDARKIYETRMMVMATDPDGYRIELIGSDPAG